MCEPEAAPAPSQGGTHTTQAAAGLTCGEVIQRAAELGYLWSEEEAERFIAYNRDYGRKDNWDFAIVVWERNRKQRKKTGHTIPPSCKTQAQDMLEYLKLVH